MDNRSAPSDPCGICSNTGGNRVHEVREMQYGTRERFDYLECGACGCLQIGEVPEDLGKYYPPDYHGSPAVDTPTPFSLRLRYRQWKEKWVRHRKARYCLTGKGSLGKRFVDKYGRPVASIFGDPDYFEWLKRCGVSFSSRILDVGCADGGFLRTLRGDGFRHLTGVDPFIPEGWTREGVRVIKADLSELEGPFDLVMFHHSFEHMADPLAVLGNAHRLLGNRRYALVRIPVTGSHSWREYGTDWVGIDAPRHLFLHTPKSMRWLADRAGFQLEAIQYDSTEFGFWASEQYRQDIPLRDGRSHLENPGGSIFTPEQIDSFRERARELNRENDGDQACFYLQKK